MIRTPQQFILNQKNKSKAQKQMKSNIRDYMNKNNITSSSRDSQELRRPVIEEERFDKERNIDQRYNMAVGGSQYGVGSPQTNYIPTVQPTSYTINPKYLKSKAECVDELTKILDEIDRKDGFMRKMVQSHNAGVLKKFNDDYDNLAQQIIRTVETQLRENKERLMSQIRERRNMDLAECKPIRRNMDKLKNEVVTLRDGLHRENQYRQYISRIVVKDFEVDLGHIQQDIDRLRLPNVELGLDEKYYTCFRSDLNRLIVVRDELTNRIGDQSYSPQSPSFNLQSHDELNPHINRDQIKRSQVTPVKY